MVFFGTPEFAKNQLLYLLDHGIKIIAVVTQPDKPRGRKQKLSPSPVKQAYLDRNLSIPLFQPEKASSEEFIQEIQNLSPDMLIVVAYGQILKQQLLDIPSYDCINVHASLLPKYRGAAPIQRAIANGEKETGITIMKIVKKLDAGDMLLVKKIPIPQDATFEQIESNLSNVSGPALIEVIKAYESNAILPVSQDEDKVTYAHKITSQDLLLDFSKDAESLHNQIRAFSPKPGAYCLLEDNKRCKILLSKIVPSSKNPYENIEFSSEKWVVACGKSSLQILRLQLEGKKAMDFKDFVKGHPKELALKKSSISL